MSGPLTGSAALPIMHAILDAAAAAVLLAGLPATFDEWVRKREPAPAPSSA